MKNCCTYLTLLFCIVASLSARAQLLPPGQPEQDPCNALILCGGSFSSPYSYQGEGASNNLPSTICGAGESNSMWIKLEVATGGTFVFTITPEEVTDDYDFAVINATGIACNAISAANVVRCNFNNNSPVVNSGIVGLSTSASITSVAAGTSGSSFVRHIDALAGETYYIMINNFGVWGAPSSGFTIDFSGSTATFNAGATPTFAAIKQPNCGNNSVTVKLSTDVLCSSIAVNGSDFTLSPLGTVSSAFGTNCTDPSGSGYTDEILVNFASPLPPGEYVLRAQSGTDGNTLLNLCNNALTLPEEIIFSIPKLRDTVRMTRCVNQMPFEWNGITISSAGAPAASKSFISSGGCDSTAVLYLNVVDAFETIVDSSVCTNQIPFVWNGITITGAGNPAAIYNTTSASGCDSTVFLNLEVTPIRQTTDHLAICSNQLPYIWNGISIPEGATSTPNYAVFNTVTPTGCDSVVTLGLTVFPTDPITSSMDTTGCGAVIYKGITYYNVTTIIDTIINQNGCDSIYNVVNIIVYNNEPSFKLVEANGCKEVVFEGITYLHDTLLVDTFRNRRGCDSLIRHVQVYVEEFELSLSALPEEAVQGEYITLTTSANVPNYTVTSWEPGHYFSNQSARQQIFTPFSSEEYVVTATSDIGCLDTAKVKILIDTLRPELFLPTAFSPNGDGLNDLFGPIFYNKSGYTVKSFRIFNRWGNVVYKAEGNSRIGWNGNLANEDKPAPNGVYFYILEVEFVNKQKLIKRGDVTLLR
jgi:gliding motility-associated-like protein